MAVLAGAVAAGQQQRKYLAVLYKTLGATRGRIIRAELLEFGLLGLATALAGAADGDAYGLGPVQMGLRRDIRVLALAAAETVLLALALVLGVGAIATYRVLSAKAAPYLRAE